MALAISLEEEDERVYADYPDSLRESFPASAAVFEGMRADETGHRQKILSLYRKTFGEHIPLIRRQDVRGFVHRRPVWLVRPLGPDTVSMSERPTARGTPASANCSTILPRKSPLMRIAPNNSSLTSYVRKYTRARIGRGGGCSCSKSYGRVLPV
jgi:Rubrerythrin